MSRESWLELRLGRQGKTWRQVFQQHHPLAGRTTDPEALDFDEASDIFLEGLRLARRGNIEVGRSKIATAYLLDTRSINWSPVLPQGEESEAGEVILDAFLLYALTQDEASFASNVLRIMAAGYLGDSPVEGQTLIAVAMKAIDMLETAVKNDPKLGGDWSEGGVLGGCMSRTNLLFHRASLHMSMGNHKKAISSLTKALEIDSGYTRARDARASLWTGFRLRDEKTIHAEYKQLVSELHVDSRGLEVAYGWLAHTTLRDAQLGTVPEAKQYYKKCLRAQQRHEELYGKREPEELPQILGMCKEAFAFFFNGSPEFRKFREDCDAAVLSGRLDELQIPDGMVSIPAPKPDAAGRHKCLKCGKMASGPGERLYKCSRCKKVSYCSRDCQTSDWRSHKVFCKSNKS